MSDLRDNKSLHRYMTMAGIRYLLKETGYIWSDPRRCGGRPCLQGHRYTLHQLIQELAEVHNDGLQAISQTHDLDFNVLKGALIEVAQLFDCLPTKFETPKDELHG